MIGGVGPPEPPLATPLGCGHEKCWVGATVKLSRKAKCNLHFCMFAALFTAVMRTKCSKIIKYILKVDLKFIFSYSQKQL